MVRINTALPGVLIVRHEVQVCHWVDSKWIVSSTRSVNPFASSGEFLEVQLLSLPLFSTNCLVVFNAVKQLTDRNFCLRPRMFASSKFFDELIANFLEESMTQRPTIWAQSLPS